MSKKFFTNGNIVDVIHEKVFKGSVLVEDGIIKEVGEKIAAPADAEVIDLGGMTMTPGFFNCHTHVCMKPLASMAGDETDCTLTLNVMEHLQQYLSSGVTFIRDVGGSKFIDIEIRDAVKAGRVNGPDMYVCGKCVCMTGGHGWQSGREADGPDECRKAAREQLRAGADWIKVMATGGVMTKGVEPGSAQLTEEEMRAACEEAHKVGAKVATHAQGNQGIRNALHAGVDSVEHGIFLDEYTINWMLEHGTWLVPTLCAPYWINDGGLAAGIPDYVIRKNTMVMGTHFASFTKAYKAGVKIALGTDAGTPFNRHDKTMYEVILMTKNGMSAWDAVKAGTINAATMLEVDKSLGSIEVGKKAHFAVWEKNPIEDVETVMNCKMTVKNGEIVYKA